MDGAILDVTGEQCRHCELRMVTDNSVAMAIQESSTDMATRTQLA